MTATLAMVKQWLSVPEAAVYAGVSTDTIRDWIAAEKIKHYRPNRRILIDRSDLDNFIRAHAR
jgi:excisionase family DNA binding protein